MDIRQFEYLVALTEERHFTRAAERCNVTQPTLSGRIRQLEEDLGVPIVQRGQRYHGLTPEGEQVLRWARVILEDRASMMQTLSELKSGLAGRLTIGIIPSALPMASSVSRALRVDHPGVTFTFRSMRSSELVREIHDFQIDAGITYIDNEPIEARLDSQLLYTECYRLFVPSRHPWAGRESVTWAEAATLPLALLTSDMQNRRIIDDAFLSAQCRPQAEIETDSVINLWSHVRFQEWASIMPEYFQGLFGEESGIRGIDLVSPSVEKSVGLLFMQRSPAPPLVEALREACRDADLTAVGLGSPGSDG